MKSIRFVSLLCLSVLCLMNCSKAPKDQPVKTHKLNVRVFCNNHDANNRTVYLKLVSPGTSCLSATSPKYINIPVSLAMNQWENNLEYASFEIEEVAEGNYSWCAFIDMDQSSSSQNVKIAGTGDLTISGTINITSDTDLIIPNTNGTGWSTQ
jgi:hypothetical protein